MAAPRLSVTTWSLAPGPPPALAQALVESAWQEVVAFSKSDAGQAILALGVLVAGWYVSRLVVRYLGRPVARRFQRPSVTRTVLRGIRVFVLLAAVVVALRTLGLGLPNIVLSVTVVSAVVGLVLAPLVGSVINGLFVLADQPYEVGDMIEISDTGESIRGFVEDITIRYTKIFTVDNTFMVVPNATMRERDVVNYSAEDERTRLRVQVLVTYESDVEEARRLIERAARDVDDVIAGGPDIRIGSARYSAGPRCYIDEYADNGVLLTLRYWAERPYKLLALRSRVNERIWAALEDSDVTYAYPHQHLVFDETSGRANVVVDRADGRRTPARDAPSGSAPGVPGGRDDAGDPGRRPDSGDPTGRRDPGGEDV